MSEAEKVLRVIDNLSRKHGEMKELCFISLAVTDAVVYKRRKETYKYQGGVPEENSAREGEREGEGGRERKGEMESLFNVNQLSDFSAPEAKE